MARNFVRTHEYPVVASKAGKLRGYQLDSTFIFQGIKYCNAERFQMPTPVEPWEGIKDADTYGFICPMLKRHEPSGEISMPHRFWPEDEHCQYLNIWTQSLDPNAKKPVLVWIHGGGYAVGSSIEQVAYDGENMSKYGDVVVVSINHRLNILGYLNLEAYGERYKNSANAGNADMVAALQWIHDNIEGWGGDPENVTIFGQSGGGMKVWNLMQTPSADGLFHKGIVQSGVGQIMRPAPDDGTVLIEALLKELHLSDVKELETIPYALMAAAYNKISPELAKNGYYIGGRPIPNDWFLGDPRLVGFTEHAKTIPTMVGTVLGEFLSFSTKIYNRHTTPWEDQVAIVTEKFGEQAPELIEEFQKAYPDKPLFDLLTLDSIFRAPSKEFIAGKSLHPEAPTYSYLFTHEMPLDDGKSPWHCAEIPYVFHNAEMIPYCNIPGASDLLEERVFGAWIQFARTGDPSHELLPDWPACTPDDEACMIFDMECEVRHNHDNKLIALYQKTPNGKR